MNKRKVGASVLFIAGCTLIGYTANGWTGAGMATGVAACFVGALWCLAEVLDV